MAKTLVFVALFALISCGKKQTGSNIIQGINGDGNLINNVGCGYLAYVKEFKLLLSRSGQYPQDAYIISINGNDVYNTCDEITQSNSSRYFFLNSKVGNHYDSYFFGSSNIKEETYLDLEVWRTNCEGLKSFDQVFKGRVFLEWESRRKQGKKCSEVLQSSFIVD